ncbi:MAG: tetratricopeptide repeat protein [bacterium]
MNNKKSKRQPKRDSKAHKQRNKLNRKFWYWLLGILAITLIAYLPSFGNGFTNWDDQLQITNNDTIKELSLGSVKTFFTTYYVGMYQPIVTLSYAIEHYFFGLNPKSFHIDSVILHLLNISLVYGLIYLLTKRLEVAVIVSSFFALNPMQVEAVAWISARSTLLYSFFYLGALNGYLFYIKNKYDYKYLYLSLVLFTFSVLSKSAAVSLPALLILMDFYYQRKLTKKLVLEKVPYFMLSLIFGIVTIWSRRSVANPSEISESFPLFDRLFLANHSLLFYLVKLITPFNQSAFYPYPEKTENLLPLEYYIAPFIIILIILGIYKAGKYKRDIVFGISFFLIPISLVLQVVPVSSQIVADRYTYIPIIGFTFLLGFGYKMVLENRHKLKNMMNIILMGYLLLFAVLSYNRTKVWENSLTLWSDVISKYPKEFTAWHNRANARSDLGDLNGAIADYNMAIKIRPGRAEAYSNRGNAKKDLRDFHGAIKDFNKAIELKPDYADAYSNRGIAKGNLSDFRGAIEDFNKAIQLKPDYYEAYFNRGITKGALGDHQGEIEDYTTAILYKPDFGAAFFLRGMAKIEIGQKDAGCLDLQQANKLGLPEAYNEIMKYCISNSK